jgi:hypothetical protein
MVYPGNIRFGKSALNWNWPDLPAGTNPSYPAQPIGNTHAWTITSNNSPCGLLAQSPVVTILGTTPESCAGTADGNIAISVTGGSGPFTLTLWSNGSANHEYYKSRSRNIHDCYRDRCKWYDSIHFGNGYYIEYCTTAIITNFGTRPGMHRNTDHLYCPTIFRCIFL